MKKKIKYIEYKKMAQTIKATEIKLLDISIFHAECFDRTRAVTKLGVKALKSLDHLRFILSKIKDKQYPKFKRKVIFYSQIGKKQEIKHLKQLRRKMLKHSKSRNVKNNLQQVTKGYFQKVEFIP